MKYLSVCSGIEAATCAWHPLGWEPFAFSEIEKFPSQVLAHHYPQVTNFGDMTKFEEWPDATIDLLVGGTPCQSFSVAGLRKGLDDPRGNLMLTYGAIAAKYRPEWLVWENVPGVLSSNGGRDFGTFLRMLGQLGYGFAYRILDAQFFGVAQRRRRVFVVGCLGDWRSAAAVLFERHSLQGHPAPSREAGKVAPTIPSRSLGGGGLGTDFDCDGGLVEQWPAEIAPTLNAHFGDKQGLENQHINGGCGLFVPAIAFPARMSATQCASSEEVAPSMCSVNPTAIAFNMHKSGNNSSSMGVSKDRTDCLRAFEKSPFAVQQSAGMQVRRLTPEECESLQGFPRGYTKLPGHKADGPRYKALGNSFAVPVVRWIGERISAVDAIKSAKTESAA